MGLDFSRIIDFLEVGIVVVDGDGQVLVWNHWLETHGDFSRSAAEGRKLTDICPDVAGSRLEAAITAAIEQRLASLLSPGLNRPVLRLYQRLQDRAEDLRMQQLIHVIPLPADSDGPARALVQVMDMTASAKREQQLRSQSSELRNRPYLDTLTGIANRRRFNETIASDFRQAVQEHTTLAVIMLDIDRLRAINDKYGTQAGDQAIKDISVTLSLSLLESGHLLARYSGEAFAVLLKESEAGIVCALAQQLRTAIEELHTDPVITVSVGAALMHPDAEASLDTLISGADMALYQSQRDGSNCVTFFNLDDGSLTTLPH